MLHIPDDVAIACYNFHVDLFISFASSSHHFVNFRERARKKKEEEEKRMEREREKVDLRSFFLFYIYVLIWFLIF